MSYYNTTHLPIEKILIFSDMNLTQEGIVHDILRMQPTREFGASEIWKTFFDSRVPLTSIRRAISDLHEKGKVIKTSNNRTGIYGRAETCWKYKTVKK